MTNVFVVGTAAAASSARAGKIPGLKAATKMATLNCFTFMAPSSKEAPPRRKYSLKPDTTRTADQDTTYWILVFYGRASFFGLTQPSDEEV
jgi:hypothetical protein